MIGLPATGAGWALEGPARVNDTGNLVIGGREVALAGIDMPIFDRACRQGVRPIRCGPRAVLVLDAKVRGFMHCEVTGRRSDQVREGRCTVAPRRLFDDRVDLAAELLREGWAFARDDAPELYRSLARTNGPQSWQRRLVRCVRGHQVTG